MANELCTKQKLISMIKKRPRLYKATLSIVRFRRRVFKVLKPKNIYDNVLCFSGAFFRRFDFIDSPLYKKLKLFKNVHTGQRCFIICTGPSLRINDLDKLKDEVCISLNSIVKLFGETSWRPNYYYVNNRSWLDEPVHNAVKAGDLKIIFTDHPSRKRPYEYENGISMYRIPRLHVTKLNVNKNGHPIVPRGFKFSANLYEGIGRTYAGQVAMQIAVYMGFNEIYLYGADGGFSVKDNHHQLLEYGPNSIYTNKVIYKVNIVNQYIYEKAKEYADAHDIKIYNASRGGNLEVFERVDLDEVLATKSK